MIHPYKTYLPALLLLLWASHVCHGQNADSLTTTIPTGEYSVSVVNGDTVYRYLPEKWELRSPASNTGSSKRSLVKAATTKSISSYSSGYMDLSHIPISPAIDNSKDIGEIPISQGSSNGALTYSIPIEAYQASNGLNPSIQLTYSSMAGNGVAGYGWQIGGLSAISIVNRNYYYDNFPSSPTADARTADFALDGMRLIQRTSYDNSYWLFESEQGNIKVLAYYYINSYNTPILYGIRYFKVFYPNGNIAIYGFENDYSIRATFPLTKRQICGEMSFHIPISQKTTYIMSAK